MFQLEGKKALVTAAGQGIGAAAALVLAEHGAQVLATDINGDLVSKLKTQNASISTAKLDVTDHDQAGEVVKQAGNLDILVNCAGFVHDGTILDCKEEEWDFAFDLNVKGTYRMIRAVLPGMLAQQSGSIINIASVASSMKGIPRRFVYGSSKAAVIGLTKSVAADFVKDGIRANAICPGTVDSPSLRDRLEATGNYEEARKAFVARQPMERIGEAEEIAALVLYLASDRSCFMSGQALAIDGGWTI